MGTVSYKLMRIFITRRIKNEVDQCIDRFKDQAKNYSQDDPKFTENLLQLSLQLTTECRKITLKILNEYDKELEGDAELLELKGNLLNDPRLQT